MKSSILKPGKKYTFSDYFHFNCPTKQIVGEFGYTLTSQVLTFPEFTNYDSVAISALQSRFYKLWPLLPLTSEQARRDFLIGPLLLEIIDVCEIEILVQYQLYVDELLNGFLDYLMRGKHELLVIEAKKGDMDKGFNQLAIELIALDKTEESGDNLLYGAITVGDFWQFGILDRANKQLIRDIHSYRIPQDTESVFKILMGIITHA